MKKYSALALLLALAWIVQGAAGEPAFDHAVHQEQGLACADCHTPRVGPHWEASMPDRNVCLDCHEDQELPAIPPRPTNHSGDFRYEHQFAARGGADCATCHRNEEKCAICHHGENVDFLVHDRNWRFTHALTDYKGTEECATCHDTRNFCQDCHQEHGIRPGSHFQSGWGAPQFQHGDEARLDLGSCIQCHGGPEPVCKDCHGD